MSIHDGLTHESTKPENMLISWLSVGLRSDDLSLDRDVIPDAMLQAGFKTVIDTGKCVDPGDIKS